MSFSYTSLQPWELLAASLTIIIVFNLFKRFRRRTYTTPLDGPPSSSFLFGVTKEFLVADDPPALHIKWAEQYGPAFKAPRGFGGNVIVLADPKACAHFHAKETFIYINTPFWKSFLLQVLGPGLLSAEGQTHRKQRKTLTPAFSNASIRRMTNIFYDSAYKVRDAWDNIFQSQENPVLDVQAWANKVSLDSIGITAFSHQFGALDGKQSSMLTIFDRLASKDVGYISKAILLLSFFFPWLSWFPSRQGKLKQELKDETRAIGAALIRRAQAEHGENSEEDKSILGLLLKSEQAVSEANRTSREVVMAQVTTLILAGYETTSISLTWSLLEMCKKPSIQETLRQELLSKFPSTDPTWDDLWYNLPYLDAVCLETLRLHLPLPEISRMTADDDIIPLSRPLTTATGETVTSISVAKGTYVTSSIGYLNRAKEIWGPDADEFKPERWLNLEDSNVRVKEIQGHKHIMTFSDGPRICLGKNFALAEWKATLAVFLRNFTFELPDGPDTQIELHLGLLKRPKIAGSVAAEMLMKVKKLE